MFGGEGLRGPGQGFPSVARGREADTPENISKTNAFWHLGSLVRRMPSMYLLHTVLLCYFAFQLFWIVNAKVLENKWF